MGDMKKIKSVDRYIKFLLGRKGQTYYEDEQVGTDENGETIYRRVKKTY
jgi:hypothetical protein